MVCGSGWKFVFAGLCAWSIAATAVAAADPKPTPVHRAVSYKAPAAKPVRTVKPQGPARRAAAVKASPRRPSLGEVQGLHATQDPLELKSSVALVVDQDTNEVLFSMEIVSFPVGGTMMRMACGNTTRLRV